MNTSVLQRPGMGGNVHGHAAMILKQSMYDGMMKIFEDELGAAQRIEIEAPEGKVMIIKDYEKLPTLSQYKRIEVYSLDGELLDSLNIFPEDRMSGNSLLRFYYGNYPIGSGTGELGMILASKLLNVAVEPRRVGTSSIDPEVVDAIKKILARKSV